MSHTVFTRCRRTGPTRPPAVDLAVDAPPAVPRTVTGAAARLVPLVMAVASVGAVATMVVSGPAVGHTPMLVVFPVMMVASAVAAVASGGGRQRAELDADRRRYLNYLASLSRRLTEDAVAQRNWLLSTHPEPDALWTVVGDARMWVRHRGEEEFCAVRVGVDAVPATTRLTDPVADSPGEQDPVTAAALRRLLRAHGQISEAPVTVPLAAGTTMTVNGNGDRARALLRALICQLAVAHSPDDVGVIAAVGEAQRRHWDWLKWLPHLQDWSREPNRRRLVVVVDGGDAPATDATSTVLRIDPVTTADNDLRLDAGAGVKILTRPDQMTPVAALAVARRLAGHRTGPDPAGGSGGWLARVGVSDPARIDPETLWGNRFGTPLPVPIGADDHGGIVDLDIREAASDGMGPHGLCLGATGSGKSELLRTIALGMIARHSPETLNLVLVDFKGGATFLDLAHTRHTTAVITNLEEEAGLVDRMREALGGEIDRRQRILRSAGNLAGVAEYHRARRDGRPLAPLPALFIIVDEFSELLSRHPEFVDVFVAIGRLGRSLGMHLLLASQRLDEGRLRGLDSHLSYRICLKTLSEAESRMAIGVADAYHLPRRPGAAYLKVGAGQPVRFQATYVSGPVSDLLPAPRSGPSARNTVPRVFTAAPSTGGVEPSAGGGDAVRHATLLEVIVGGLAGYGPSPHRVWLPPLADSPRLGTLTAGYDGGGLRVPIGLVDNSFEHRRDPLVVDMSGSAGHLAVVGAPRTGKTTVLKTLVTALAATHDPRRVQVYCIDFGGGGLSELAGLPHVGSVAGRSNADLVRRTLVEILAVLRRREAAGTDTEDPYGDVLLVIDGWAVARRDHGGPDDLEEVVTAIAGAGLAYGVHVVLTASRWADIRPALRDQIGTRIELRLGDPADSEIDRARARRIPADRPGHGLSPDGLPMVIALPDNTFRSSHTQWQAPPIRLLPERVDFPDLPTLAPAAGCVLGIDEDRLQPVTLDLTAQHLLVFGEPGCGKTAVLRLLCHEIVRTVPDGLLVPVDPRRTLAEFGGLGLRLLPELIETLRERVRTAGPVVRRDLRRGRRLRPGRIGAGAAGRCTAARPRPRTASAHRARQWRRGARALRPGPVCSARDRAGGAADERLSRRRAAGGWGASAAVAARPRHPGDPRRRRTDHPGGLDGIVGAPVTAICEVGPGAVRLLHGGNGATAAPALVEAVLDAGGEPLALLDDKPMRTEALWCAVFEALLTGADEALLVCPSWWPPPQVEAVAGAARTVAETVITFPRHRLLHRGAVFIEIGPEFVVIGDHEGILSAQTRWAAVDIVARAVADRVGGRGGPVHIDAPAGVPGAAALGSVIARRLRADGRTVRQLDDHQLCAAATRSAGTFAPASPPAAGAVRRRRLPAAGVATATVVMTAIAVIGMAVARQTATSATELVEGRVAVRIPAAWSVQRITGGPGSARVQAMSPVDPGAILHITQSRVSTGDLAATAEALRSAVEAQPVGLFVDFNPDDRRADRPAVTYRELRPGHDIRWTVVVSGRVRISIGCQSTPGRGDHIEPACEQAIRSAREIG